MEEAKASFKKNNNLPRSSPLFSAWSPHPPAAVTAAQIREGWSEEGKKSSGALRAEPALDLALDPAARGAAAAGGGGGCSVALGGCVSVQQPH